ncbi:MAG: hypothetical protein DDT39_01567 [Firmicutes bacterium]|nr:hypothetical protein [candidate division NPL-UPA2 bacterium]
MIELSRLAVSLTKHGAHKIAALLKKYDKDEILDRLEGVEPGINIEEAQARKNLSVDRFGKVPEVWNKARAAGGESIDALVLIGIIFSHHDLLTALREARTGRFRGTIERGKRLDGKAFTNTAHIIEELGYSVSHTQYAISYNFSKLFEIPGLNRLAAELIAIKLRTAGWDGKTDLVDELLQRKLNESFAVSEDQFRNWLTTGDIDAIGDALEDEGFFLDSAGDVGPAFPFTFTPGHTPKKTGVVEVSPVGAGGKAVLLHNHLQTKLYAALVAKYGKDSVRTELPTGHGTSIDVVVKTSTFCWFYEIKVAKSLKACIRQAIPQLLEYAYWRTDNKVADRLYIASTFTLTKDAEAFLKLLRERFNLPIYYHQILDS